jgi:general secretion pathway protein B
MLKQLKIQEVKPGMMVTQVIAQNGPVRIRKVGMIKSQAMVIGLTEMGVSIVEVDEAQSLSIESDNAELAASAQIPDSPSMTPTQRLMASDKQLSAADRQLSQQFHRSLFMPAIDEMPSRWKLYVKPYVILSFLVIVGFAAGFSVMHLPQWLAMSKSTQLSEYQASEPKLSEETPQASNIPENNVQNSEQALSDQESIQPTSSTLESLPSASLAEDESLKPAVESELVATEKEPEELVQQRQSINGIVLNEGETILGYNAPEPQSQIDTVDAGNLSNEEQAPSQLSADLLRRVNQAAAVVDSESDIPVTDIEQRSLLTQQMLDEVKRQGLIPVTPSGTASARAEPLPRPGISEQQPTEQGVQARPMQRIDQLPASVLTQMPAMSFSAHMYASNPTDRWVRVNSRRLSEGDFIVEGLSIVEIAPENIVLSFKGEVFTMNALSDW